MNRAVNDAANLKKQEQVHLMGSAVSSQETHSDRTPVGYSTSRRLLEQEAEVNCYARETGADKPHNGGHTHSIIFQVRAKTLMVMKAVLIAYQSSDMNAQAWRSIGNCL